ncbi:MULTISPECIES: iron-containing alcohol dehydrogenase family protein [Halorussus]|uniref:iron-containing alcohol dehydrogenase family protein n=1 Tax=Halorussus TaxID=1070314 RepID=UPI000E219800|nr:MULTISPECIES: iron-containing alcohol dehydrogenase family protein [Halorussus]NHN60742.1 iron-containing alcohol dehydrogenase [Halorussus sp. JP-T4]
MLPVADAFEHEYRGCDVVYGRGCADRLGEYLADRGLDRALVVCGSNVGANDDLMDPVRAGLGDRLVGVFDGTTPEKQAEAAFEAIDAMEEADADVLVGVGGGSSLDVARQAGVFAADGRSLADLREEARDDGEVAPPDPDAAERPPVVVIPTTFAGADVSAGGSLEVLSAGESPTGQPVTASGSAMPLADFADPALFETTPAGALAGSAMNGVDKGIETPYARDADPVSDATAVHGLRLLSEALPAVVGDGGSEEDAAALMDRAVVGALLVQFDRKLSVVHAFGHGFARRYDVQQGAVHAVVVPHVLRYLFSAVDAARDLLAQGFGVETEGRSDDAVGEAVVDAVTELRDSLGTPTRLRDLPETREEDLPAIAEFVVDDRVMERAPAGLDASAEDVEDVLREAW